MSGLRVGSAIGPYEIEALVGQGGMAEVYRVRHRQLHRVEALKVMLHGAAPDPQTAERFLNDARIAAGLKHPNIITIFMVGEQDGLPFIAMEYVEGESLEELLARRGTLDRAAWGTILAQAASALDAAHVRGVVHRDVKPANVLVRTGANGIEVKVVDFGIARSEEVGRGLTRQGMIVGTPEYMAPEQIDDPTRVGSATDQYALAVLSYEMLCGRPPFPASEYGGPMAVIMAQSKAPPPRPRTLAPALPPATEAALLRALSKEPRDRFPDCRSFVAALGLDGTEPKGAPERRRLAAPLLVGVLALAGVGLVLAGMKRGDVAPEAAPTLTGTSVLAPTAPPAEPVDKPVPEPDARVPNAIGLTAPDATAKLEAAGFKVDSSSVTSDAPKGQVVDQSPKADTTLARAGRIAIVMSQGRPQSVVRAPDPPKLAPTVAAASFASSRPVTDDDLRDKGKWELDVLRNELYARHGKRFKRADLRSYFSAQAWYRPDTDNDGVVERRLSPLERANAERIHNYQKAHGKL